MIALKRLAICWLRQYLAARLREARFSLIEGVGGISISRVEDERGRGGRCCKRDCYKLVTN